MLGIRRHRPGGAKTVELHALGVGHGIDGGLQGDGIEALAHLHQGVQGGVENLQAEVGHRIGLGDRELAEAGAGGQALRQAQFQVLKAGAANGAAEAHDGRLTDADVMGEVRHGAVHHRGRVEQHVIGHLEFRLTQQVTGLGDVLQKVHRAGLGYDRQILGCSVLVVILHAPVFRTGKARRSIP